MLFTDEGPVQTPYSDNPAYLTGKPHHVYRDRDFPRESRVVALHEPPQEMSRGRRDTSLREHRRTSRSANPPRREMVLAQKSRRRRDSSTSDSDSDSDTDGSSPRRIRSRRHYAKASPIARAGPVHVNPPTRSRSTGHARSRSRGPPGPPRCYESDSDSSSDDDDGGKKAQPRPPPPKQILYTGLACVATIAAANNIYQSAKAHHARRRELEEGDISVAEAQKLKTQARKMDLISLGVAAVGAYNVRNGWRRAEGHWKAHREGQAEERR